MQLLLGGAFKLRRPVDLDLGLLMAASSWPPLLLSSLNVRSAHQSIGSRPFSRARALKREMKGFNVNA